MKNINFNELYEKVEELRNYKPAKQFYNNEDELIQLSIKCYVARKLGYECFSNLTKQDVETIREKYKEWIKDRKKNNQAARPPFFFNGMLSY